MNLKPTNEEIFENRCRWARACKEPYATKTTERLRDEIGHCCLGLACEIFLPPERKRSFKGGAFSFDGERSLLPKSVQKMLGLSSEGHFWDKGLKCELSDINDGLHGDNETLFEMGSLIEWLLIREYLFGETVFVLP